MFENSAKALQKLGLHCQDCCHALTQTFKDFAETHPGDGVTSTSVFLWVTIARFDRQWHFMMSCYVGRCHTLATMSGLE